MGRPGARCVRSNSLFVAPLREVHVFEIQGFLVKPRLGALSAELPDRRVREGLVITLGFAVRRLMFTAEMKKGSMEMLVLSAPISAGLTVLARNMGW